MIFHYLRHAFRVFSRNSGWLIINLTGLSVGLAASFLILLYIANEISFDRFHQKGNEIYRVLLRSDQKDNNLISSTMPAAIGASLGEEFPEIRQFCRVSWPEGGYFRYNNQVYSQKNITWADSTFFSMFTFPIIQGDGRTMLSEPYQLVLTRSEARKMFRSENPIGKTVEYNGKSKLIVTGVVEDFPANSHLQFDALISFSTLYLDTTRYLDWNGGNQYMTYILTGKEFNPEIFQQKLTPFLEKHINYLYRPLGIIQSLNFEPLRKIHLSSPADQESGITGGKGILFIFGLLAAFILFISIFNFTNLATAKAMSRARETGIRKVAGADRRSLVIQYMSESLIMALLGMLFSVLIIEAVHPYYSALVGYNLDIFRADLWWVFPAAFVITLITGISAGAYPAFYLSGFEPEKVLKGGFSTGKGKKRVSAMLVILQFFISLALLNCTLVLLRQMDYIRNYDPGFQTQNVMAIALPDENMTTHTRVIIQELKKVPGVIDCSAVSEIPGAGVTQNGYFPEGFKQPEMIHVMDVDEHAVAVLGLTVLRGRNFESASPADANAILVNETFARQYGWNDPIGKKVYRDGEMKIIGVVKDFHFSSLHSRLMPLILNPAPFNGYNYVLIKTANGDQKTIIAGLEDQWKKSFPGKPFNYISVSSYITTNYGEEQLFSQIFIWFTGIAIILAFMGLLGLSSYSVKQQRKEIGLRKIFGASSYSILFRLAGRFLGLSIIASLAAIPVSWLFIDRWLANFSYHTEIPATLFAMTTLLAVAISLTAVAWQSVKASLTNPAEVIQYE